MPQKYQHAPASGDIPKLGSLVTRSGEHCKSTARKKNSNNKMEMPIKCLHALTFGGVPDPGGPVRALSSSKVVPNAAYQAKSSTNTEPLRVSIVEAYPEDLQPVNPTKNPIKLFWREFNSYSKKIKKPKMRI